MTTQSPGFMCTAQPATRNPDHKQNWRVKGPSTTLALTFAYAA
eukprot:CAMPEP_0174352070 /NCGR_PEP_ID=MMETSP0811_2-20130205/9625_1 /TAXON_ID=73025 ORGANISM="Eutreptiella gymnastica-like, Strain CCMP1594" /NCGR_SAMPLE_ID=MMETSP0811_2 /ASSEMBLY_ACC=CAM_ASM_000667 /LENGTH=42 /DNA_ID= /DNA_START= /DNA_END= /DNA_ORIENTATION=